MESQQVGFTKMELFIVVILLAMVSAVVVPQFSRASEQARYSVLMDDLQEMRAQLDLYRIQHDGLLPGQSEQKGNVDPEQFVKDLTTRGEDGLGPYMKRIPRNVFNGRETITFVNDPKAQPDYTTGTGWWLNAATGDFRANDSSMNTNY